MTTDSNHSLPTAPNILNRDFYASKVDEKYVGDITYILTSEGWLYLATVIDLYSRKIVGFYLLVSGLRPFYCPVELRFCVRPHSDIGVQFRPIFAKRTSMAYR
ncbi:MAG: hypothetical protein AB7E37_06485 [Candidatus Altimarinota bacterium]